MKVFTTILIALLISVSAFAQQDFPRNEVKLNLFNSALFFYPEISYERILSQDISIGASLGFRASGEYVMNFNFTPHFRWFFGGNRETVNRAGTGFFIEANTSAYSFTDDFFDSVRGRWVSENTFGFGIGLGIGWKYLTTNNWVGELMLGGGRDLINDGGYPRLGISLGRRF